MTLILSEGDVSSVLNMSQGVQIVERAFADYPKGQTIFMPRISQSLLLWDKSVAVNPLMTDLRGDQAF